MSTLPSHVGSGAPQSTSTLQYLSSLHLHRHPDFILKFSYVSYCYSLLIEISASLLDSNKSPSSMTVNFPYREVTEFIHLACARTFRAVKLASRDFPGLPATTFPAHLLPVLPLLPDPLNFMLQKYKTFSFICSLFTYPLGIIMRLPVVIRDEGSGLKLFDHRRGSQFCSSSPFASVKWG